MDIKIYPSVLQGSVNLPASKSVGHRMILAAALAEGESVITGVSGSEDIAATVTCAGALGSEAVWTNGDTLRIRGSADKTDGLRPEFECGESGSTLRFLIPVALAKTGGGTFLGRGRLMQRPQEPYRVLFAEKGISWEQSDDKLCLAGWLRPGQFTLPGDVSSQFITGLLYALPLLDGDSEIRLTTVLESAGYVDLTIDALEHFGIRTQRVAGGWNIPGGQRYRPACCSVEKDFSQAAFFYAANGIGNRILVPGMREDSKQGDRIVLHYMEMIKKSGDCDLSVRDCPDLLPALTAAAALQAGKVTRFTDAARLRIKESDRLHAVTQVLSTLGARIAEGTDSLSVRGVARLQGGTVDSFNDHRIAMMAAVAATCADGPVTIRGAECVRKSYPDFWKDYRSLGGEVEEIS